MFFGTGILLGSVLGYRSIALRGFGFIGGIATFLVLSNALGWLLPTDIVFPVVAFLHSVFAIIGFAVTTKKGLWIIPEREEKRAMILLFAVTVVCAFSVMRTLGSDPWFWAQYSLAATIAEGNLGPVREVGFPDHSAAYHYGPQLLVGAMRALTGLPLELGFGLLSFLSIGGFLCFAYEIARKIGMGRRQSLWGAILAFAGGGLLWLNAWTVVSDLLSVARGADFSPYRSIVYLYASNVTNALFTVFQQRSTALGYPLLFALFFLFMESLTASRMRFVLLSIFGIVVATALSLVMETGLLLFGLGAGMCSVAFLCSPRARGQGAHMLLSCVCMLLPALLISFVQGGVLSHLGEGSGTVSFDPSFGVPVARDGTRLAFWSPAVLIAFGLPVLLLPWTAGLAIRQKNYVALLIIVVAITHLLLPFLVTFDDRPSEMVRLLFGATSLGALLAGWWFVSQPRIWRIVGTACMLLSSVLYLGVRLTFPTLRFEVPPLIERLEDAVSGDIAMANWIDTHTTIDDRFYVRSQELGVDFLDEDMRDVILFSARVGRFVIADYNVDTFPPENIPFLRAIEERCDSEAFRALGIDYFASDVPSRMVWFTGMCDMTKWEQVFESPGARIWRLIN